MAIAPMRTPTVKPPKMQTVMIDKFGGDDYNGDPTQISLYRSTKSQNITLDIKDNPDKRPGYKRAFPDVINPIPWTTAQWETDAWEGEGAADTPIYHLSFNPVANKFVIAHDDKLWTFTEGNNPVQLYQGVTGSRMVTFFMNNKQYFLDGTNYLQWDGIGSVIPVESVAKVPILTLGRTPTGGGTPNEQFNLLGNRFRDSFSSPGGVTAYTLSLTNLDSSKVFALVNNVKKYEGTDLTVDRATGVVTFTAAPGAGTNNVIIEAGKTVSDVAEVVSLVIDTAATASGNVTINLDGISYTVAISNGDTTSQVATKIRSATYTGWTTGGTTNTVTFTSNTTGVRIDTTYNEGNTGARGTVTVTTQGSESFPNKIKRCTIVTQYGGANDTRVFLCSGLDNIDYRSGLYDPTYWPENDFTRVGSTKNPIIGYAKQGETLEIIKGEEDENDAKIWLRTITFNSNGVASFPVRQGVAKIGCGAVDSIHIINDKPVYLSAKKGVYRVESQDVKDERSIVHISDLIDPVMLAEPNLKNAVSFDYNGKYGVAVNGNVYVYDYLNPFVDETDGVLKYEGNKWTNINAKCFLEHNGYLYFGSSKTGMVYRFKKLTEDFPYNDDGQPIEAYWYSKIMAMDAYNMLKFVEYLTVTLKPSTARQEVDVYYATNKVNEKFAKALQIVIFDFGDIDFGSFDFLLSSFPQSITKNVNKELVFFQVILKNNRLDEGMSISNISYTYSYQGLTK